MGAVGWRVRWRLPALRGTLREVCMAGALTLTRPAGWRCERFAWRVR